MEEEVMAKLFGEEFTRERLMKRIGDVSQVGGVKASELKDGREKGVEVIEFRTGSGFNFKVLPGRCMDISLAEYNGIPLCWCSPTGEVAPEYYEERGLGWLRSFYGGLLVTCGLRQIGQPCEDEGEELGLHGRISNIRAENVSADGEWRGDDYVMWAAGRMAEATVFGENLCLRRRIESRLGDMCFTVHDIVENLGHETVPHMILYHINGGFPVVDEGSELISASLKAVSRDEEAEKEKEQYNKFLPPTPGFKERCYDHDIQPDEEGIITVALANKRFGNGQGFGFYVSYPKKELPHFVEWKMNGEGTYVVGVEPGNALVEGRSVERKEGRLQFLEPGEKREYHLTIGVLPSNKEISALEEGIREKL
jgi:hypothetical protein